MCVACARSFQDAADLDAFCSRHNASSLSNEDKPQRVVVDLEIATQEAEKRVDTASREAIAVRDANDAMPSALVCLWS